MPIATNAQERSLIMGQPQQKRRAVLIVEDDAELCRLTAALFEDDKVDTITCETAEAALATMLIRGREVALIFAEIRLPGVMDGVDLAREVRMRWPFLPVVLTSGLPRRASRRATAWGRLHAQAVATDRRAETRPPGYARRLGFGTRID
jgi:CheY-like chemotaxis protein